jgi:hypothetical protein
MSQWWVKRSSSALVILASIKTLGHSPKARLVTRMIEVRYAGPGPHAGGPDAGERAPRFPSSDTRGSRPRQRLAGAIALEISENIVDLTKSALASDFIAKARAAGTDIPS